MPFVLTEASDVHCPNEGKVSPTGQGKLTVESVAVVLLGGIRGKSVDGCTIATSNTTKQCSKVTDASGAAGKLTIDTVPVALNSLRGATDGSTPGLAAIAKQSKLKAV